MFQYFKKIFKQGDIIWSLAYTALRMSAGILILPLALRSIPSAEMGIYYTFMSLSGLAMMLDFGMVGTIGRSAAYAWGGADSFTPRGLPEHNGGSQPNRMLLASLTHTTRSWYCVIALTAALLLIGIGTFFVKGRADDAGLSSTMTYCWLFFSLVTAYGLGTSYWNVLLTGIGDVRSVGRFGVLSQIISIIIMVICLLSGLKVWSYALALLIGPAVDRHLAKRRYLYLIDKPLPRLLTMPDFSIIKTLWPMTWRMGISILGIFLMQRGNTLISSVYLGLETTAKYGLTLNLFTIILQISGIALYVANPRIAKAHVQRDVKELRRLYLPRLYGGLAVAACGGAVLIVFGPELLNIIGSKTGLLTSGLATLLFTILILDSHQNAYVNLVISSNENPFVVTTLVSSLAMVGIAMWSATHFGLLGLILTHGLVQLACNHWWPVVRGIKLLKRQPSIGYPANIAAP